LVLYAAFYNGVISYSLLYIDSKSPTLFIQSCQFLLLPKQLSLPLSLQVQVFNGGVRQKFGILVFFWSHTVSLEMGKKEQYQQQQRQKDHRDNDRVEAVLKLLRKQATLTVKQVGFCYFHCSLSALKLSYILSHCSLSVIITLFTYNFFYSTASKCVSWFSCYRLIICCAWSSSISLGITIYESLWYVTINWQEKFCNNACVERFLRAKGDSVKKAAKHLRACLSWRESTGTGIITSISLFHILLFIQKNLLSICSLPLSFLQPFFLFVSLCSWNLAFLSLISWIFGR